MLNIITTQNLTFVGWKCFFSVVVLTVLKLFFILFIKELVKPNSK